MKTNKSIQDPGIRELIAVGTAAGLKAGFCKETAKEIETCVKKMLGAFL